MEIIFIIQANIKILFIAYTIQNIGIPKEISVLFHSASNYDYHFIIKEVVEEFKGKSRFLGEDTEKKHYLFRLNSKKS